MCTNENRPYDLLTISFLYYLRNNCLKSLTGCYPDEDGIGHCVHCTKLVVVMLVVVAVLVVVMVAVVLLTVTIMISHNLNCHSEVSSWAKLFRKWVMRILF